MLFKVVKSYILLIPKLLHYCWFGSSKKPDYFQNCFNSWKSSFFDFQIIEWNESNSDLSHPFLEEAIRKKKWAFVSDFIRIQVLVQHGGIYLDTDMLFVRPFDPQFLNYSFFLGMENSNSLSAGVLGCEKENGFFKEVLEFYINLEPNHFGKLLIPEILNRVFLGHFNQQIKPTEIGGGKIFPCQVFYPLPFKLKRYHWRLFLLPDSVAVHLWAGSWMDSNSYSLLNNLLFFLKRQFSRYYVPRSFFNYRDRHFGI